jgi:hypothetical protein
MDLGAGPGAMVVGFPTGWLELEYLWLMHRLQCYSVDASRWLDWKSIRG